ncbi:hypothetical protein ACISU4_34115, partial [Streptomyces wuyuanensis]
TDGRPRSRRTGGLDRACKRLSMRGRPADGDSRFMCLGCLKSGVKARPRPHPGKARKSAATARNAAESSAAQAQFSAEYAGQSAREAGESAEEARHSAIAAGKSQAEADAAASQAWAEVKRKREAEIAEAKRRAEEVRKAEEARKEPGACGYTMRCVSGSSMGVPGT